MSCSLAGSPIDPTSSCGDVDGDVLALGFDRRREVGDDAAEELLMSQGARLERLLPRIEPGEPQQVLDQPLHARRCGAR